MKAIIRAAAWAAALCSSNLPVTAADLSGNPGAFAPISMGARGTGLAGAQTAAPDVVEAIIYNPAAMANTESWSGGYYYSNMYNLIPYHYTSATFRPKARPFVLGAAWLQNGDDVYSENEVLLGGAWSRGWVKLGGTYKLRFAGTGPGGSQFTDAATNLGHQVSGTALGLLGFDVGATIQPFGPKYTGGFVFKDLLSRIAWNTSNQAGTAGGSYAEYVPVSLRYGFLFQPDAFMALSVDYDPSLYHDTPTRLASGIEALPLELLPDSRVKPFIHDLLAVRTGYARNLYTKDASHRFSLGAGIAYAYSGMCLAVDMSYEWVYNFESNNNLRVGFNLSR